MNTLTRWEPLRELEELQDRISAIFGNRGTVRSGAANGTGETSAMTSWTPLVDISEDEKAYLIKADLPGVKKEDVKVTVENGALTLSGERQTEAEEQGKTFHRVEKTYGRFLRSFGLPDGTDTAKVSAEFKDGVLQVRLPKSESARPQTVAVKVE